MVDSTNTKKWAEEQADAIRKEINYYINQGMDKDDAVEMCLENTTIGAGYKAQIRYEFK